jgi:hypothetical protein
MAWNITSFSGGHCLVAWRTMTLPKENGGLNIIDIRLQNQCLLLKWLWVAIKEPDSLWCSTLTNLGITFTLNETTTNHHTTNPNSSET